MKIRRFYGKDMREALSAVKDELGGDAVIMSNRKVGDGIELVAAYDKEPIAKTPKDPVDAPVLKVKPSPSLSEIIGDSGTDSLKALLEKQHAQAESKESINNTVQVDSTPSFSDQQPAVRPANPYVEKPPVLNAGVPTDAAANGHTLADQKAMKDIRNELSSLRNVLQFQVAGLIEQDKQRTHPLRHYLTSRLVDMGISADLAEEVVSYAPESASERDAWLFLLKLLANRLTIGGNDLLSQTGVVALLGATGTGKTTTVAKLAARYAQKYGADQIGLVTIDSYRIAAYEQLATYGKIIGCSVKKAHNSQELADVLHQFRTKRLVIIDTAGFGQRDARLIKQLATFNEGLGAEVKKYLCLQANSQYQVMDHTIEAYNGISLHGCIFTKLDECYSLGEAISVAIENQLPVSYITDGQKVPEDMKVAEARFLISTAAKLYKQRSLSRHKKRVSDSAIAV